MITLTIVLLGIIAACILAAISPMIVVIMILPIIDISMYYIFRKIRNWSSERKEKKKGGKEEES